MTDLHESDIPVVLTEDERRVWTAVFDLSSPDSQFPSPGPATASEIAAHVSLLFGRFGVARASRTLSMLVARGVVRRRRPKGSQFAYEHVRRPTDEERG